MCCVLRFFQNLENWIFGKIFKFFGLDLDKKSIVRDGFFPCLAQMIIGMRGCVAYNDLWPWPIPSRSTMGHLFYATSSFVHYFVATGEFKLELQSGNAQSGSNSTILEPCDLEMWQMTLKHNRAPLLSNIKLCASFHRHMWIQTGVTVRKRLNEVMTSVTLTFDLDLLHGHHVCRW